VKRARGYDTRKDILSSNNDYFFSGSRKKAFWFKRIVQLAAAIAILLAVIGLSRLEYPASKNITNKVRYYLTDERSNQMEAIIGAVQSGVWMDSFENGVLETLGKLQVPVDTPEKPLTIPVSGKIIRPYGWEEFEGGQQLLHPGIDIQGLEPLAPVHAAASGSVRYIGKNERLGNYVELDHGDGMVTVYGHCGEIAVVEGQKVKEGEVIAHLTAEPEPYLHFEVRYKGKPVDPLNNMSETDLSS